MPGAIPHDGRNALVAAADLALRLKAGMRDGLSVNPARIDGGGPNNVVPDLAVLRVNLRPRSLADQAAAQKLIDSRSRWSPPATTFISTPTAISRGRPSR
jgi:glutamate carboxypeptidase